jgi:hypothetical protein
MGFAASMSAVVQLPSNLMPYAQEADQLAAFAGKKCVGKGEKVEGLYYVTIYGTTSEAPPIHFQYYSARNKYMYTSGELFAFEVNKVFGVRDTPEILPLTIAE